MKKTVCLTVVLGFLAHTANIFLGNIAVFEASTGHKFNFMALLHNPYFWIILAIQILSVFLSFIKHEKQKRSQEADSTLEQYVELYFKNFADQASDYSKAGDFVSAKQAIEVLNKILDTISRR